MYEAPKVHGIVYLIRNSTNGKVYIGQTIQQLSHRWNQHKYKSTKRTTHLCYALRKYGSENFTCTELGRAYSQSELDEMEVRAIWTHQALDNQHGYNTRLGGGGGPMSEEHKRKIGNANAISLVGKTQSSESNEKRRRALSGRTQSAEAVARRIAALLATNAKKRLAKA